MYGLGLLSWNLLNETPADELTYFVSNLVYTNAQTTSAVIYPEGNPELTSYISGASEVPLGTHVDVQATNILLQEMFSDENAHHIAPLPEKKIPYTITTPQPNSLQAKAKKLMHKAKKNMRNINFRKAVARKFREYDQKLEALTNFDISEAFEKAIQARVLTEIKKLLPTHILKVVANYVMPRLNTSVIDVMKNNQINMFTQSSTSIDDLSYMDLNLKLLNRIHLNKSNETHTNHQQLYDTLYDSITLDQDALNAQDANPSFHKRSHDNQDPPNNLVHAQDDTPAIQTLDPEDEYIRTRPNLKWYTKSGSAGVAKRKTTWFDLLLKSDIDQNKNHILGPLTVTIAKKLKAIIQKDELTIVYLEGARLERLKQQYQNDVELEYHVDQLKSAVLSEAMITPKLYKFLAVLFVYSSSFLVNFKCTTLSAVKRFLLKMFSKSSNSSPWMHTRASNSELVEPLSEPERTLNRRLRRQNKRVPFERRDKRPTQPRIVYLPILDINYFRHFIDILENYNPMDDEPM
ncbi:hypothetical protein Tco_0320336 [Tanacetum coccineum]